MADAEKKPKYVRLPLHPSIYEGIETQKDTTKEKRDQKSEPDRRFPMEYLKPQGQSRSFVRALARDPSLGNWINKLPLTCKLQSTETLTSNAYTHALSPGICLQTKERAHRLSRRRLSVAHSPYCHTNAGSWTP